jgi:hypothetical protein
MANSGFSAEVSLVVEQVAMFDQLDAAAKKKLRSHGQGVVHINAEEKTKDEVFRSLFGDSSITPARERYYSAVTAISNHVNVREKSGWAPRSADDNGIDTLETTYDWHVWLEDKDGNIIDYPDNELCVGCPYKTEQVVRQEWRKDLVKKIQPRIEESASKVISDLERVGRYAFTEIARGTFPLDRAHVRAKALYDQDPTKYKFVIGSLGFVQSDGRVFWELG